MEPETKADLDLTKIENSAYGGQCFSCLLYSQLLFGRLYLHIWYGRLVYLAKNCGRR